VARLAGDRFVRARVAIAAAPLRVRPKRPRTSLCSTVAWPMIPQTASKVRDPYGASGRCKTSTLRREDDAEATKPCRHQVSFDADFNLIAPRFGNGWRKMMTTWFHTALLCHEPCGDRPRSPPPAPPSTKAPTAGRAQDRPSPDSRRPHSDDVTVETRSAGYRSSIASGAKPPITQFRAPSTPHPEKRTFTTAGLPQAGARFVGPSHRLRRIGRSRPRSRLKAGKTDRGVAIEWRAPAGAGGDAVDHGDPFAVRWRARRPTSRCRRPEAIEAEAQDARRCLARPGRSPALDRPSVTRGNLQTTLGHVATRDLAPPRARDAIP